MPVWSLAVPAATNDDEISKETSMNIVTFATPVSVDPSQFILSLYHGTRTKDMMLKQRHGVLQLLCPQHKHLVAALGKHEAVAPRLLPECALYLHLTVDPEATMWDVGDHVVAHFRQTSVGYWDTAEQLVVAASSTEPTQSPPPLIPRLHCTRDSCEKKACSE
eukprot:CAMPEP_0168764308 /NCGR_PEP_ID=MMETSP0724-20121128/24807_1 /TAXON_ID=265536 /ORGANISM="Amphiprora sp., Strain CCMP467" /LENGTH=162 /DNA_ID=CAMNT_0008813529 /DNA_START=83 /DNA_END=568 /DNA_ORIENTATION=+